MCLGRDRPGVRSSGPALRPRPGLTACLSAAQYFAITMVIVGLSVVVTVIVLQYHHHDPDGGQMPKWVRSAALPGGRGAGRGGKGGDTPHRGLQG